MPVLKGAGTVSHEEALDWADDQYSGFAKRRGLEAESDGPARYIDDLTAAAKLLESRGAPAKRKARTPREKQRKT